MTAYEIVVIVGGMILGYYIVSILLLKKPDNTGSARADSEQHSQQHDPGDDPGDETDNKNTSLDKDYVSANWYHILDISQTSSREEIIAAYKLKIGQYHPDKVARMGVEIRELAEQKSMQINAAYNYAMRL